MKKSFVDIIDIFKAKMEKIYRKMKGRSVNFISIKFHYLIIKR